jgi:integrase
MSDNTLYKTLRIMGWDTGPGGDHRAHGFRLTASTLLNEEDVFDGHIVEAQLAHSTEKKSAGGTTRWCGATLARATRMRSAGSITVQAIAPNACI